MKKSLGKGLEALFGEDIEETIEEISNKKAVFELKISQIEPNIEQPRKQFDEEKINELAKSIKDNGLIQPIVVSKEGETYKINAGERRWRAARIAGLTTVPVYIKDECELRLTFPNGTVSANADALRENDILTLYISDDHNLESS